MNIDDNPLYINEINTFSNNTNNKQKEHFTCIKNMNKTGCSSCQNTQVRRENNTKPSKENYSTYNNSDYKLNSTYNNNEDYKFKSVKNPIEADLDSMYGNKKRKYNGTVYNDTKYA